MVLNEFSWTRNSRLDFTVMIWIRVQEFVFTFYNNIEKVFMCTSGGINRYGKSSYYGAYYCNVLQWGKPRHEIQKMRKPLISAYTVSLAGGLHSLSARLKQNSC